MNIAYNQTCTLCGGTKFNKLMIEKGYMWADGKLFSVKNFPGTNCSDCKEDYISRDLYYILFERLCEGLYDAEKEEQIPVYDFQEEAVGTMPTHRFDKEGNVYCVNYIPFIEEGTNRYFSSEVQKALKELHNKIEAKEVEPARYIPHITVSVQKN